MFGTIKVQHNAVRNLPDDISVHVGFCFANFVLCVVRSGELFHRLTATLPTHLCRISDMKARQK